MTLSELAKLHGALGDNQTIAEFRRMEQARPAWTNAIVEAHRYENQVKNLLGQHYAAVQTAKQMYDLHKKA